MNRLLPSPRTLLRPQALLRPPHGATPTGRGYSTAAPSPLRLAVIGAGPAGFYTSYRVLGQLSNARVDMYESLPVPYGLVRYGVAPDHPEVKVPPSPSWGCTRTQLHPTWLTGEARRQNCQDKFGEVARSPRFTYIGNTPIGTACPHPPHHSLPLAAITPHYDALLLSYGASRDRTLGIAGEATLAGIHSARAFVGWYNGLPECAQLRVRLDEAEDAVVIGHGNVALDVARILLTPVQALRTTDMATHAVEALARSRIRRVRVVGRRGPLQVAFSAKELRELLAVPGLAFSPPDPALLSLSPSPSPSPQSADAAAAVDAAAAAGGSPLPRRQQRRLVQLMQTGSATPLAARHWQLDFLRSPTAFLASAGDAGHVGGVRFDKMRLEEPVLSPSARARPTGECEDVRADVVFRSIGYLSEPIPGLADAGIPFDAERGLVPNRDGRVVRPPAAGDDDDGRRPDAPSVPVPGVYTSGWVKRGPTGVIASTMYDAFETADAIVHDWLSGTHPFLRPRCAGDAPGWPAVLPEVRARGMRPVSWDEWLRIDVAEKARGARLGKEREKFISEEEMLAVLE